MPNAKKARAKKTKEAQVARGPAGKRGPASAAVQEADARIKAANSVQDLSSGLEPFLAIDLPASTGSTETTNNPTPDADPVRLEIRAPDTLGKGDAQRMYDLLKSNMHDMYVEAGWGWHADEKWREMAHRDARFVMAWCGDDDVVQFESGKADVGNESPGKAREGARSATSEGPAKPDDEIAVAVRGEELGERNGSGSARREREARGLSATETEKGENDGRKRLAGYCHFRFAWDADENEDGEGVGGKEDVLYVYELQVDLWAKRRGLGRRMMQAIELLANRHGMTKVMLTVFKENQQAISFYTKKMRYGIDKDSPSNWNQPDEVYEILSKPTRQGLARVEKNRTATLMEALRM